MKEEIKRESIKTEVVIPVKIESKTDVSKEIKHSKQSVLFVNKKGQANMVPADMAESLQKENKGYIVDKTNEDYLRLFKMAVGYDDKVEPNKFSQVNGKVVSVEATVKIDAKKLVEQAKEDISKGK